METKIITFDIDNPDPDKLGTAAKIIKKGGLVAFPTETVYGLGANALDHKAIEKIYQAKGRPQDNPLIVHIADTQDVAALTRNIPPCAFILMEKFWPGPLTLIMHKSHIIPEVITAGLDTVAIRMPSHPVALDLIKKSGLPIAAPSANTSGKPSPTTAQHVIDDLYGKVDIIIDGGSTDVGLESTVLDITAPLPIILRPGGITPEQLEAVLGNVDIDPSVMSGNTGDSVPRSPGTKYRHYSPKADVIIVEGSLPDVVTKINLLAEEYTQKGKKAGVLATEQTKDKYNCEYIISMGDRNNPISIASNLFSDLRMLDEKQVNVILAEAVDNSGIGLAIMNRMNRAAGFNVIKV